jgi:hypothetical protein
MGLTLVLTAAVALSAPPIRPGVRRPASKERAQPADNVIVARVMERFIFWGFIVGRPVRGTLKVVSGGRTVRVDVSHARILREENPAPLALLTPGTFVRVEGTTVGTVFHSATLDIITLRTPKAERHRPHP